LFEAGAISNSIDKSNVCPILFEVKRTDVKFPLALFQFTEFNEKDIHSLVTTINKQAGDNGLDGARLDKSFRAQWPRLDDQVRRIMKQFSAQPAVQTTRDPQELLEETLQLVRSISSQQNDIAEKINRLAGTDPQVAAIMRALQMPAVSTRGSSSSAGTNPLPFAGLAGQAETPFHVTGKSEG